MKKLAIIGAGTVACDYVDEAHKMGVEALCFAWEEGALAKTRADRFYPISVLDKDAVLEICRQERVDGVVATTELTIHVAAYIAEKLSLTGICYERACGITNKELNRQLATSVVGLEQPRYQLIDPKSIEVIHVDSYPVIVKPVGRGGKQGVSVAVNEHELASAIDYAKKATDGLGDILIEEYIEGGIECSIESLSFRGKHYVIQVTEKVSSGPPHCVELGHHQPARISEDLRMAIARVIPQALDAIGLCSGPCHTEVKIKQDKLFLIEFNARPGGDRIAHPLVQLSTGYSYLQGAIRIALGEDPLVNLVEKQQKNAGICFVTEQTKSLIPIFEECEKQEWCYEKNDVGGNYSPIQGNNPRKTNYFVYVADRRPDFTF